MSSFKAWMMLTSFYRHETEQFFYEICNSLTASKILIKHGETMQLVLVRPKKIPATCLQNHICKKILEDEVPDEPHRVPADEVTGHHRWGGHHIKY